MDSLKQNRMGNQYNFSVKAQSILGVRYLKADPHPTPLHSAAI